MEHSNTVEHVSNHIWSFSKLYNSFIFIRPTKFVYLLRKINQVIRCFAVLQLESFHFFTCLFDIAGGKVVWATAADVAPAASTTPLLLFQLLVLGKSLWLLLLLSVHCYGCSFYHWQTCCSTSCWCSCQRSYCCFSRCCFASRLNGAISSALYPGFSSLLWERGSFKSWLGQGMG